MFPLSQLIRDKALEKYLSNTITHGLDSKKSIAENVNQVIKNIRSTVLAKVYRIKDAVYFNPIEMKLKFTWINNDKIHKQLIKDINDLKDIIKKPANSEEDIKGNVGLRDEIDIAIKEINALVEALYKSGLSNEKIVVLDSTITALKDVNTQARKAEEMTLQKITEKSQATLSAVTPQKERVTFPKRSEIKIGAMRPEREEAKEVAAPPLKVSKGKEKEEQTISSQDKKEQLTNFKTRINALKQKVEEKQLSELVDFKEVETHLDQLKKKIKIAIPANWGEIQRVLESTLNSLEEHIQGLVEERVTQMRILKEGPSTLQAMTVEEDLGDSYLMIEEEQINILNKNRKNFVEQLDVNPEYKNIILNAKSRILNKVQVENIDERIKIEKELHSFLLNVFANKPTEELDFLSLVEESKKQNSMVAGRIKPEDFFIACDSEQRNEKKHELFLFGEKLKENEDLVSKALLPAYEKLVGKMNKLKNPSEHDPSKMKSAAEDWDKKYEKIVSTAGSFTSILHIKEDFLKTREDALAQVRILKELKHSKLANELETELSKHEKSIQNLGEKATDPQGVKTMSESLNKSTQALRSSIEKSSNADTAIQKVFNKIDSYSEAIDHDLERLAEIKNDFLSSSDLSDIEEGMKQIKERIDDLKHTCSLSAWMGLIQTKKNVKDLSANELVEYEKYVNNQINNEQTLLEQIFFENEMSTQVKNYRDISKQIAENVKKLKESDQYGSAHELLKSRAVEEEKLTRFGQEHSNKKINPTDLVNLQKLMESINKKGEKDLNEMRTMNFAEQLKVLPPESEEAKKIRDILFKRIDQEISISEKKLNENENMLNEFKPLAKNSPWTLKMKQKLQQRRELLNKFKEGYPQSSLFRGEKIISRGAFNAYTLIAYTNEVYKLRLSLIDEDQFMQETGLKDVLNAKDDFMIDYKSIEGQARFERQLTPPQIVTANKLEKLAKKYDPKEISKKIEKISNHQEMIKFADDLRKARIEFHNASQEVRDTRKQTEIQQLKELEKDKGSQENVEILTIRLKNELAATIQAQNLEYKKIQDDLDTLSPIIGQSLLFEQTEIELQKLQSELSAIENPNTTNWKGKDWEKYDKEIDVALAREGGVSLYRRRTLSELVEAKERYDEAASQADTQFLSFVDNCQISHANKLKQALEEYNKQNVIKGSNLSTDAGLDKYVENFELRTQDLNKLVQKSRNWKDQAIEIQLKDLEISREEFDGLHAHFELSGSLLSDTLSDSLRPIDEKVEDLFMKLDHHVDIHSGKPGYKIRERATEISKNNIIKFLSRVTIFEEHGIIWKTKTIQRTAMLESLTDEQLEIYNNQLDQYISAETDSLKKINPGLDKIEKTNRKFLVTQKNIKEKIKSLEQKQILLKYRLEDQLNLRIQSYQKQLAQFELVSDVDTIDGFLEKTEEFSEKLDEALKDLEEFNSQIDQSERKSLFDQLTEVPEKSPIRNEVLKKIHEEINSQLKITEGLYQAAEQQLKEINEINEITQIKYLPEKLINSVRKTLDQQKKQIDTIREKNLNEMAESELHNTWLNISQMGTDEQGVDLDRVLEFTKYFIEEVKLANQAMEDYRSEKKQKPQIDLATDLQSKIAEVKSEFTAAFENLERQNFTSLKQMNESLNKFSNQIKENTKVLHDFREDLKQSEMLNLREQMIIMIKEKPEGDSALLEMKGVFLKRSLALIDETLDKFNKKISQELPQAFAQNTVVKEMIRKNIEERTAALLELKQSHSVGIFFTKKKKVENLSSNELLKHRDAVRYDISTLTTEEEPLQDYVNEIVIAQKQFDDLITSKREDSNNLQEFNKIVDKIQTELAAIASKAKSPQDIVKYTTKLKQAIKELT